MCMCVHVCWRSGWGGIRASMSLNEGVEGTNWRTDNVVDLSGQCNYRHIIGEVSDG